MFLTYAGSFASTLDLEGLEVGPRILSDLLKDRVWVVPRDDRDEGGLGFLLDSERDVRGVGSAGLFNDVGAEYSGKENL